MKRLLLVFVALIVFGCNKDDGEKPTPESECYTCNRYRVEIGTRTHAAGSQVDHYTKVCGSDKDDLMDDHLKDISSTHEYFVECYKN